MTPAQQDYAASYRGPADERYFARLRELGDEDRAPSPKPSERLRALPSLTSLSAHHWPAPPRPEAFAGLVGQLVDVADPHTEADPVAVALQALVAFGSAVDRGPHVMVGATRHGTNTFLAIVGDTAKARKGDSFSPVHLLFRTAVPEWTGGCTISGLNSSEGLVWAIRDPIDRSEPVKEKGRVVGYETVRVDEGNPDKRLLVRESELGRLIRVSSRQGSTLSMLLREAWDGGDMLRTVSKASPATATGAHVSAIGHVTIEELRRELADVEVSNGWANRFLWAAVRRSKLLPEPQPLDEPRIRNIATTLADTIGWASQQGRIERDADARDLWRDVYPRLAAPRPGLLGAILARAEAHTLRLSLLYALLGRSPAIGVTHLQSALAVWDYVERSAEHLFGNATGDPVADSIVRALSSNAEMTRSAIRDLFGRHESSSRIDAALRLLAETGRATSEQRPTGGRPVEIWRAA